MEEFEMYEKDSQIRQSSNMNRKSYIMHHASCIVHHDNERGIALVIVLVLSVISLAIMAGLLYMVTSGTQISGIQKRYKTALEAGKGGKDVTYQFIRRRGDPASNASFILDISEISPAVTTPTTCTGIDIYVEAFTGLAAKLRTPTASWSANCSTLLTITPLDCAGIATTQNFDICFNLGPYTAYAKIVDTVEGNTFGHPDELEGDPTVPVLKIPFLYTIEIYALDAANTAERAKLSILYEY